MAIEPFSLIATQATLAFGAGQRPEGSIPTPATGRDG